MHEEKLPSKRIIPIAYWKEIKCFQGGWSVCKSKFYKLKIFIFQKQILHQKLCPYYMQPTILGCRKGKNIYKDEQPVVETLLV